MNAVAWAESAACSQLAPTVRCTVRHLLIHSKQSRRRQNKTTSEQWTRAHTVKGVHTLPLSYRSRRRRDLTDYGTLSWNVFSLSCFVLEAQNVDWLKMSQNCSFVSLWTMLHCLHPLCLGLATEWGGHGLCRTLAGVCVGRGLWRWQ